MWRIHNVKESVPSFMIMGKCSAFMSASLGGGSEHMDGEIVMIDVNNEF